MDPRHENLERSPYFSIQVLIIIIIISLCNHRQAFAEIHDKISLSLRDEQRSQNYNTSSTSFTFNGFDNDAIKNNISLSGIAALENNVIKLTNTSARLFGRAFYTHPVYIKNPSMGRISSFSTTFVFCISPLYESLGGHGMAFLLAPSMDSSHVFPSQYLGLLNSSDVGQASDHLFAVEFDTVQDLEFEDINDNHIGVNLNSLISNTSKTAGFWTRNMTMDRGGDLSMSVINLKGGDLIQAWISYNGYTNQLNVSIAPVYNPEPGVPLISVNISLFDVLVEQMYVGISASTGVISGTHRLLSWSFNSDGEAPRLDLSKLPSIFPKPSPYSSLAFRIGMGVLAITLILIIGGVVAYIKYRRKYREVLEDWELEYGIHRYSYKELIKATGNFSDKELLGVGGFGRVYRGVLPKSGLEVAVKKLSRESEQGQREFLAEMESTGQLQHRNLVRLLGWSRWRDEFFLVYDYMPNGSLDKFLFDKSAKTLRWEQRHRIVKGIASAIHYLHEGSERQVLHRDIKSSNVLLDADMNAKLGDFGLARLYEHGQNPHTTRVVGTLGYLAPEYASSGKVTTATDVYSFGVLLLEVATGRRPIEHQVSYEDFLLVDSLWDLFTKGRLLEAVDPRLDGLFHAEEMQKFLMLGLLCAHHNPLMRPSMEQVVEILSNRLPLPFENLVIPNSSRKAYMFNSSSNTSYDDSSFISAR